MKKTLAILATVATVGALAITAPAQARGIGPGIAFGLAAGAIAAGAAGAYGYYGPGYGYYGLASPLLAPALLVRTKKARSLLPGFFLMRADHTLTARTVGVQAPDAIFRRGGRFAAW